MSASTQNRLLDSLSPKVRESIVALCRPLDLPLHTMLQDQDEVPRYAYFLTAGIGSVVVNMAEGGSAEVGLIGCEGCVGALQMLGPTPSAAQTFVQHEGRGLRIRMDDLRKVFLDSEEFRGRMLEFLQQQSITLAQVAACNKLHEAEERLARWLLMAADRSGLETMQMTQEFLADMLGTRRTTVTMVAGALQRSGLIEYQRGRLTILSREKLEEAACECYRITKDALDKLYRGNDPLQEIRVSSGSSDGLAGR